MFTCKNKYTIYLEGCQELSEELKYQEVTWKYVLQEDYTHPLHFHVHIWRRNRQYYEFDGHILTVRKGYAWDGASGPTIDTDNTIKASLIHDVLYQAIREGVLPPRYRRKADYEFRCILRDEGMNRWRR